MAKVQLFGYNVNLYGTSIAARGKIEESKGVGGRGDTRGSERKVKAIEKEKRLQKRVEKEKGE